MSKDRKPGHRHRDSPTPCWKCAKPSMLWRFTSHLGSFFYRGRSAPRLWGFFRECPSPAHEWP